MLILCNELNTDEPRFPTCDNIEAELARLCQTIGLYDLLLVHFACHGSLVAGKPVLITHETRASTLAKKALPLAEVAFTDILHQVTLSPDQVQAALESLQRHDVVKQDNGQYIYTVELMRRWVAQQTGKKQ